MTARMLLVFMLLSSPLLGCGGSTDPAPTLNASGPADRPAVGDPSDGRAGGSADDTPAQERRARLRLDRRLRAEERRARRARQRDKRRLLREQRRRRESADTGGNDRSTGRRTPSGDDRSGPDSKSRRPGASEPTGEADSGWRYDKTEVHLAANAIRAYVAGLGRHDPGVCTEWLTQAFMEAMTGRRGAAAVARCRKQISSSKVPVKLLRFGGGKVRPGQALIEYAIASGGTTRTVFAHLLKQEGRYRIHGDGSRLVRGAS